MKVIKSVSGLYYFVLVLAYEKNDVMFVQLADVFKYR
jgi:hypothetical protein